MRDIPKMNAVINWQLYNRRNINNVVALVKNTFTRVIFMILKNKKIKNDIRNGIIIIMSVAFLFMLAVGIGNVDNAVKLSQNNPFLNGIYIDTDNYILCFRYLNVSMKIPFGIKGLIKSIIFYLKPLFISILMLFAKIKSLF